MVDNMKNFNTPILKYRWIGFDLIIFKNFRDS